MPSIHLLTYVWLRLPYCTRGLYVAAGVALPRALALKPCISPGTLYRGLPSRPLYYRCRFGATKCAFCFPLLVADWSTLYPIDWGTLPAAVCESDRRYTRVTLRTSFKSFWHSGFCRMITVANVTGVNGYLDSGVIKQKQSSGPDQSIPISFYLPWSSDLKRHVQVKANFLIFANSSSHFCVRSEWTL